MNVPNHRLSRFVMLSDWFVIRLGLWSQLRFLESSFVMLSDWFVMLSDWFVMLSEAKHLARPF